MNFDNLCKEIKIMASLNKKLKSLVDSHEEIVILGNGGSSSIASHITQDYTKALGKKSFTFSDSSRLTCYINDYGMEHAYANFLSEFVSNKALVILISSSGNSDNIINSAKFCDTNNIKYVTLTGFNKDNKLNQFESNLNYWVDSKDYGIVECAHLIFLHSIIG